MKSVIKAVEKQLVSLGNWEKNYVEGLEELTQQIIEHQKRLDEIREQMKELNQFLHIAPKIDVDEIIESKEIEDHERWEDE